MSSTTLSRGATQLHPSHCSRTESLPSGVMWAQTRFHLVCRECLGVSGCHGPGRKPLSSRTEGGRVDGAPLRQRGPEHTAPWGEMRGQARRAGGCPHPTQGLLAAGSSAVLSLPCLPSSERGLRQPRPRAPLFRPHESWCSGLRCGQNRLSPRPWIFQEQIAK